MRITFFGTLVSALALVGCNSTSALDAMEAMPRSQVTTGSIAPSAPVGPTMENAGQQASAFIQPDDATNAIDAVNDEASAPAVQVASLRPEQIAIPAKAEIVATPEKSHSSSSRYKPKVFPANFSDKKPINFGKVHPKKFEVHGVDVSRWQYDIDWKKLRSRGANFAFIKATDGGDHLDPMFKTNWKAAKAAGVPRGAYHFFYWCRVASEQADWFIRNVPKEPGALPPVIDVEWNNESKSCKRRPSREVVLAKMDVFLKKLEAHYGQKPIIYTAPDFYEDNLQGQFKDYPFWLRSVAAHPKKVYPNREWLFWQYSGTGLSKGHGTAIDLNVFNGSVHGWHKWLGKSVH